MPISVPSINWQKINQLQFSIDKSPDDKQNRCSLESGGPLLLLFLHTPGPQMLAEPLRSRGICHETSCSPGPVLSPWKHMYGGWGSSTSRGASPKASQERGFCTLGRTGTPLQAGGHHGALLGGAAFVSFSADRSGGVAEGTYPRLTLKDSAGTSQGGPHLSPAGAATVLLPPTHYFWLIILECAFITTVLRR